MIGVDQTLAMDKEKAIGNSQDRHILYGKYLSNLFIVAFSGRRKGLKVKKLSDNVIVYPICYKNPFSYLWSAYKTAKAICQEKGVDVVMTADPFLTGLIGYALKKRLGLPLVVQLHGDDLDNRFRLNESKLNHILNIIGKFIVRRADYIRVVSSMVRDHLTQKLDIPHERVACFPVFVDTARFINNTLQVDVKAKYSEFKDIVLFVGEISKTKNIESLLVSATKVVKKYPETLFLLVGDGKEKARLTELTKKLGLEQNVKFEGRVTHEILPSYYQSCSLLVLPSKYEGWPRVVIEALVCERPVVISDACGNADFVLQGECGLVFPVNDTGVLAGEITHLIDNPKLRLEMGKRGKKLAIETQDLRRNIYQYQQFFEKAAELAKR